MTELIFAKSFIQTLESRPFKITADHVEDPKNYPSRGATILPKMRKPPAKRQKLAPGQERSIYVSLKSSRNPPLDVTLSALSPNTSILNLKESLSEKEGIPVEKLRILYNKKPVGDAKVLKDVIGEEETKVEFSIMVMGGAASVRKVDTPEKGAEAPVAQGPSGLESLAGEEFWSDLQGFLVQRLRNEEQGNKVFEVFKKAWEGSSK
ncbi:f48870f1-e50a-4415-a70f-abb1a2396cc8 [Sclerotinia trifoliorum]|uniref:F48870f1-e50a-4415-a70f-abb1a2396cc8 n=1 Tax=Sclerotinia trifoliorum TaxID=28548 RepID=A0A8H2W3U2_9HELO|nr:f48870f1-e50a-4415-a70f-abb1a2396cc8 [Sclerotinia trifoliorum]